MTSWRGYRHTYSYDGDKLFMSFFFSKQKKTRETI